MQKRILLLLAASLLVLLTSAAWAEAPTSQFFFTGWPYRNGLGCTPTVTPCAYTTAQPAATAAPQTATPVPPAATGVPTPAPTVTPAPTKKPSTGKDYTTVSTQLQEQKAWNLLNEDRAANSLPSLPLDTELSRLARLKSEDMRDRHYFAHESPTFGRAKDLLTSQGYAFTSVGENIAHHATVEKAHAAFLSSADHRRNMMSSAWKKVGIGIAVDAQGFVYITQLFVR